MGDFTAKARIRIQEVGRLPFDGGSEDVRPAWSGGDAGAIDEYGSGSHGRTDRSAVVQTGADDQGASRPDAGGDAQSLSSRSERDSFTGTGRRSARDGLHRLAAKWATGCAVELTTRKTFELRSKDSRAPAL